MPSSMRPSPRKQARRWNFSSGTRKRKIGSPQALILLLSLVVLIETLLLLFLLPKKNVTVSLFPERKEQKYKPRTKYVSQKPPLKPSVGEYEKKTARQVQPGVPATKEAISTAQHGRIAIVIDDWGYSLENLDMLRQIHVPLTVAILPFCDYSRNVAEFAHSHNYEIMIHMPMEPQNKEQITLESQTLMVAMNQKTIERIMSSAIDNVVYASGVNNHMGSEATQNETFMKKFFKILEKKDLFFLDSFVVAQSVCLSLAQEMKIPFARRDIFLDNSSQVDSIKDQLAQLARRSDKFGFAIGIGHDRASTLEVLKTEIPLLEEQGYRFVFVSELVDTFGSANSSF